MNTLKKSFGKYNADEVDTLLKKVRNDYENCLKEQKERIMTLRAENKEMAQAIDRMKANEQYIAGAITNAEKTAHAIIEEAEHTAKMKLQRVEIKEAEMRTAIENCRERLVKLSEVSETVCRAVHETVQAHNLSQPSDPHQKMRPVKSLFEGMH